MDQIEQIDLDPTGPAGPEEPVRGDASPWRKAGRRFIRQPAGIIGVTLIVLYIVMSLVPGLIAPYDPRLRAGTAASNSGTPLPSTSTTASKPS